MNKVIVLGNDHTNTLGIIQALRNWGGVKIAFLFGQKTGIVKSSKYTGAIHVGSSPQDCIDKMITLYSDSKEIIPVIASCDSAALVLEENTERLRNTFVFEYATQYTLQELFVKEQQVKLAGEAGFNVPKSFLLKELNLISGCAEA